MNAFWTWILARLDEPSTWVGIAGLIGSMTFLPHASADASLVSTIGVAVASILGIVKAEAGATK